MYWLTGVLGLVLAGSPFLFGYSNDYTSMVTSLIAGGILLALSALEGYADDKQDWEYWVAGVLGIGLVFAPFMFGFTAITAALWTSLIVGVITVLAAGIKLFSGESPRYG